ncbi:MAG: hypothetical protein P1V51_07870 [Deltaproteobacteria bacterium]|nr:hypothetical protein [Deltaproteobacteria bacterium]
MGDGSRLQAKLSLNLLVVVSLAAAAFWWLSPHTAPSEDEARSAATLMKDALAPGDALLLVPPWAEAARRPLPEELPVLSLPADDLDLELPGRLWVLAFPTLAGGEVDEALGTLARRFGPPSVDQSLARTRLLRFTPRGPRPAWRLTDAIASTRVTLGGHACRWLPRTNQSARFKCPGPAWLWVGAQTREIDYLPRRCVMAHPATGRPLRIEISDLPRDHRLELRAGIVGSMGLVRDAAPVQLELRRGETRLGELTVEPRPGWQRASFPDAAGAAPPLDPPPPTVLEITTPNDGGRHLCLELMAFPSAAAPAVEAAP